MVVQFLYGALKVAVNQKIPARDQGHTDDPRMIIAKPYQLASEGG